MARLLWGFIIGLCCFALPISAQEDAIWCEIQGSTISPTPTLRTTDTAGLIRGIVDLPPNHILALYAPDNIIYSPDRTRAVIGIVNENTSDQQLIGLDLINRTILFRITSRQLRLLRPNTYPEDTPTRLRVRHLQWIPNTARIAFQTLDIVVNGGEYTPPPDDLHIITETGQILVSLPAGSGGTTHFSPDGQHAIVSTHEYILLVHTDGTRIDPIELPNFDPDVEAFWDVLLIPFWQNNDTVLIAYAPRREYDSAGFASAWQLIDLWRVSVDDLHPTHINTITGHILDFKIAPDGQVVSYVWAEFDSIGISGYHAEIASINGDIQYTSAFDVLEMSMLWLAHNPNSILRLTDWNRRYHHIALC